MVEAATEDYPEVQDLLKRFTTLKDANKDLTKAQMRDEGETERLRSEFSSYTKERRGKRNNTGKPSLEMRASAGGSEGPFPSPDRLAICCCFGLSLAQSAKGGLDMHNTAVVTMECLCLSAPRGHIIKPPSSSKVGLTDSIILRTCEKTSKIYSCVLPFGMAIFLEAPLCSLALRFCHFFTQEARH